MPITRHQHHFEDLSPDDFERLVYWLVKRSDEFDQVQWYGGARDKGRDVVAYKHTAERREKWYIQCKRYQSITFSTLREELGKVAKHAEEEPDFSPDMIVFATACSVPPQAKDQAEAHARTLGLPEPYYWGRLELDERLKAQSETEKEFFGEYVGLQAETVEKMLEALDAQTQAVIDLSGSREELIGILELRARLVEEWLRRGMTRGGGFGQRRGKKTFRSSINQFRSLHQAHVAALREGRLVYAHDVLLNIHRLLHEYDYEGPYLMARDFTYTYPGPREETKEVVELYDLLEDDLMDPLAKGEILLLLVGFGENDFSDLKMGDIRLRNANLTGCRFSNSDLAGAVLQRVSLGGVDLSGTSLRRALLSNVELGAYLQDTDLRGATFHEMDLDRVGLTDTRIDGLRLVDVTNIPSWLQRGLNDDGQFVADLLVSAIQSGFRDFAGANLSGANFDNVSIIDVDFEEANLRRVSMRSAVLSGVNLKRADLSAADLQGCRISSSEFLSAKMKAVVLSDAVIETSSLYKVHVEESDLQRASFNEVDLVSAIIKGSNLTDASLRKVNLRGASLSGANLVNVDLSGIDLGKAKLEGARMQGAVGVPKWIAAGLDESGRFSKDLLIQAIRAGFRDLVGANLSHADLEESDLSGANLQGANLDHAFLSGANLSNANLKTASIKSASLSKAKLSNADLSDASLENSRLAGIILSGANLSGARFGRGYSRARDIPDGVHLDERGIFVSMEI